MFSKFTITITAMALSSILVSAAPTQLQKRDVSVINRCVNQNQVALTFDDGPYQYEQDIASRLSDSGSKGTFFLNGNSKYPFIYLPAEIDHPCRRLGLYLQPRR
jgi:peptidoglycan/xylan/chitin deacetylase (PgdA/CDA1 family)